VKSCLHVNGFLARISKTRSHDSVPVFWCIYCVSETKTISNWSFAASDGGVSGWSDPNYQSQCPVDTIVLLARAQNGQARGYIDFAFLDIYGVADLKESSD
jgi:hypothetical protein